MIQEAASMFYVNVTKAEQNQAHKFGAMDADKISSPTLF